MVITGGKERERAVNTLDNRIVSSNRYGDTD